MHDLTALVSRAYQLRAVATRARAEQLAAAEWADLADELAYAAGEQVHAAVETMIANHREDPANAS